MSKDLSLQSASIFFKDEKNLSDYYFKSSKNGEITVQKKTFFRKVCRWIGITFGYNRTALNATVTKVLNYLKENKISLSASLNTYITNKKIMVLGNNDSSIPNSMKPTQTKLSQEEIAVNRRLLSDFNKRCKKFEGYRTTLDELHSRQAELHIQAAQLKGYNDSQIEELREHHKKMKSYSSSMIEEIISQLETWTSTLLKTLRFKETLDLSNNVLLINEQTVTNRVNQLKKDIIKQENDIIKQEKANKVSEVVNTPAIPAKKNASLSDFSIKKNTIYESDGSEQPDNQVNDASAGSTGEVVNTRNQEWDNVVELGRNVSSKFEDCKKLNAECIKLNAELFEKTKAKLRPGSKKFKKLELSRIEFGKRQETVNQFILDKYDEFAKKFFAALGNLLAFDALPLDKINEIKTVDEIKTDLTTYQVVALKIYQDLLKLEVKLKSP